MQLRIILLISSIFILGVTSVLAQSVPVHIFIRDAATKIPLAYATVYSTKTQTGMYSTENGLVDWTLSANDTLIISFLSRKTQKIAVHSLTYAQVIVLEEVVYQFNTVEVKASKKRRSVYRIGFYDDDTDFDGWGVNIGSIAVNSIYNNTEKAGRLKTFLVDLGKAAKQPRRSIARLRVYEVDSLKKSPGRDLLNKNIVFSIPRFAKKLTIDLSEYDITFPLEGLFIGIEFLGFETKEGLKTSWKLQSGANITSTKRSDYRSVGASWKFPDSGGKLRWMSITDGLEHKAWERTLFKIGAEVETID